MPTVIGVRFERASKIYYFDPGEVEGLTAGERVIVDTARGRELGTVIIPPTEVPENEIIGKLKKVLRRAEAWDLLQAETLALKEREALAICKQKVAEAQLPMKLVRAEYSFDGSRLTFYFTAEKRVDFRALVRELAKAFRTRIELRQIGVRDEAKLLGGIGPCGRPLCCSTWLTDFTPVSIKMAKNQGLPLNPAEISGICGRLLCCLGYENDFYAEARKHLPRIGSLIATPRGEGKVVDLNVLTETVKVEFPDEIIVQFHLDELRGTSERPAKTPAPASAPPPPMPQPKAPVATPRAAPASPAAIQPAPQAGTDKAGTEGKKGRRRKKRSHRGKNAQAPQADRKTPQGGSPQKART